MTSSSASIEQKHLPDALASVEAKFSAKLLNPSLKNLSSGSPTDRARAQLYLECLNSTGSSKNMWSLSGDDEATSTRVEFIFEQAVSSSSSQEGASSAELTLVDCQCVVMYDDMSLSSGLEYCFSDELPFPTWHLSKVSLGAFEFFKTVKFKAWEKELRNPSCEAAFRRLLQGGPVYRVFDVGMFPSPPALADKYKVLDEKTGKTVPVPHPIAQCRIWNPAKNDYDAVNAELQGAPTNEADAKKYWAELLAELKNLNGEEYIEGLINGGN